MSFVPILINGVKIGFPVFSVDYTLPSKWRMDEVGGVKMLVIAVIDSEASFQVFIQVYKAGKIGCTLFGKNNILSNTLLWVTVVLRDAFDSGVREEETGVFLPPHKVEGFPGMWSPLAIWRALENVCYNVKYQKPACCSLILTSRDSWGSTFLHFSFTQSENICQRGSTV